MKFYLSCVGILVILLFAPDTSAEFRFRRDDPAKVCAVCKTKEPCDPAKAKMDCTKDKLSEGMDDETKALFAKFEAGDEDPTKNTHCIAVKDDKIEIRGCVAGDLCAKLAAGGNITCQACPVAAEPCNMGALTGGNKTTAPPVTPAEPGGTTTASDSSKASLDLMVCFWILCAAAVKRMM